MRSRPANSLAKCSEVLQVYSQHNILSKNNNNSELKHTDFFVCQEYNILSSSCIISIFINLQLFKNMIRCQMYAMVVFVFGCLVLLPDGSKAINCWVCSTDADPKCNDPMNMTAKGAIEDCSRAPHSAFLQPVCKKQKQRVNGELLIIRSCAWASDSRNDDGPCAINTPANIRIEHCSTCDQDLCNGAIIIGGYTVILTIILAISTHIVIY